MIPVICAALLALGMVLLSGPAPAAGTDAEGDIKINEMERKPGLVRTVDLGGGVKIDFVWCPSGSFMTGSSLAEQEQAIRSLPAKLPATARDATEKAIRNEGPRHRVTFTKGFRMAKTEVTQAQWKRLMGNNPSKFKEAGPDAPVETVSWNDCRAFLVKLNKVSLDRKGITFRLPTEAEWEYACRAGTETAYYFGDDAAKLGGYAWYGENSGMKTHPVAQKKPNAWGLYDMHGNVWEWCEDRYGGYTPGDGTDPHGPDSGSGRVGRGGGWDDFDGDLRAAYRSYGRPADFKASPLGFRPVMVED
jgi:formylglycine-generating enzyme required for sulfatase activity